MHQSTADAFVKLGINDFALPSGGISGCPKKLLRQRIELVYEVGKEVRFI
jgi:hypothetical protein